MSWTVEHSTGSAEAFHQRDLSDIDRPMVWIHRVERRALVLGSSQRESIVDLARAVEFDIEVCKRRSGGGLVLIEPDASCWIDVLLPPSSSLWDHDVNQAFGWVGRVWARALGRCGVGDLRVHDGPLEQAEAGRFLCFAGLGPGEVTQHRADRSSKVVGLSQRRQRNVARFQGLFVSSTDLDLTASLCVPGAWPVELDPASIHIGLDQSVDLDDVAAAFLAELPPPD